MLQKVSTRYGSERVCACIKVEVKVEVLVGSRSISMAAVIEI